MVTSWTACGPENLSFSYNYHPTDSLTQVLRVEQLNSSKCWSSFWLTIVGIDAELTLWPSWAELNLLTRAKTHFLHAPLYYPVLIIAFRPLPLYRPTAHLIPTTWMTINSLIRTIEPGPLSYVLASGHLIKNQWSPHKNIGGVHFLKLNCACFVEME